MMREFLAISSFANWSFYFFQPCEGINNRPKIMGGNYHEVGVSTQLSPIVTAEAAWCVKYVCNYPYGSDSET